VTSGNKYNEFDFCFGTACFCQEAATDLDDTLSAGLDDTLSAGLIHFRTRP